VQAVCAAAQAAAESFQKHLLRWLLLPQLLCCIPTPDGPAVLRAALLSLAGVDVLQPRVMQQLTAALQGDVRPDRSLISIAADAAAGAAPSAAQQQPQVQQQQPQGSQGGQDGPGCTGLEYLDLPVLFDQLTGKQQPRGGMSFCFGGIPADEHERQRLAIEKREAAGLPTTSTWGLFQVLRTPCSQLTPQLVQLAKDILSWAAIATDCAGFAPADVAAAATAEADGAATAAAEADGAAAAAASSTASSSLPVPSMEDLAQLLPVLCPMLYQWVCRFVYACPVHQQPVEGSFSKAKGLTSSNAAIDSKSDKLLLQAGAELVGTQGFTDADYAAARQEAKLIAQLCKIAADRWGMIAWQLYEQDPATQLPDSAKAVDVEGMLAETGGCVALMSHAELQAYYARVVGQRANAMTKVELQGLVEPHLNGGCGSSSNSNSSSPRDASTEDNADSNGDGSNSSNDSSSGRVFQPPSAKSCRLFYGCMHTNPGLSYDFCCHQDSLGLDWWIYEGRTRLPITECDSRTNRERCRKNISNQSEV
jgi:hypothetical protein